MVVGSGVPGAPGSSAGEAARDLAGQVLDRLRAGGETVAVAESLTGGLVAAALTDVPGCPRPSAAEWSPTPPSSRPTCSVSTR